MRKTGFGLLLIAMLLMSCGSPDAPAEVAVPEEELLEDAPDVVEEPAGDLEAGLVRSEASGFCNNSFFPIRTDTVWHYQISGEGEELTDYTITFKDITDDSFTALQTFNDDLSIEARWDCNEDGLISAQFVNLIFSEAPELDFETLSIDGVFLPPAEEWVVGTVWENAFEVGFTVSVEGLEISSTFDINIQNEITAIEPMTVPAGFYEEAVRVESTSTVVMAGFGETSVVVDFTSWYVEGVGLIRNVTSGDGEDVVMELIELKQ